MASIDGFVRGNRGLLLTVAALAVALVLFARTELDLWVQDALYDFADARWLVDARAALPRLLFYRLPKLALAGSALVLAARASVAWRGDRRSPSSQRTARASLFLLAALAVVPGVVGLGKQVTGVHCPSESDRYGGRVPHHTLFEQPPPTTFPIPRGRCFPAAHASGGFAVMALAFVGSQRLRRAGWGLGLGWVLGLYQMARGAHYLSHTVVAMLLAWGIVLGLARAFGLDPATAARAEAVQPDGRGVRSSSGS